jgi:hypothetical protein
MIPAYLQNFETVAGCGEEHENGTFKPHATHSGRLAGPSLKQTSGWKSACDARAG